MKKYIPLVLALFVAFVFLQSLFFKFAELFSEPADITVYIFSTVGAWIGSLGVPELGAAFTKYGGIVIGSAELIASVLILMTSTRFWGALVGLGVMSGAIFFHVFTPLGLFPYTDLSCLDAGCPQEKALFFMACVVWLICGYFTVTLGRKMFLSSSPQSPQ